MSSSSSDKHAQEHELKCWQPFFQEILDGIKPFELRRNDRDFQTGDILHLREYEHVSCTYTGRETKVRITCIVPGSAWGLREGYCAMGIARLSHVATPTQRYFWTTRGMEKDDGESMTQKYIEADAAPSSKAPLMADEDVMLSQQRRIEQLERELERANNAFLAVEQVAIGWYKAASPYATPEALHEALAAPSATLTPMPFDEVYAANGKLDWKEVQHTPPIICQRHGECERWMPTSPVWVTFGENHGNMNPGFDSMLKHLNGKRVRITIALHKDDFPAGVTSDGSTKNG